MKTTVHLLVPRFMRVARAPSGPKIPRRKRGRIHEMGYIAALLLSGCASVDVQQQRLVSKPNMLFSRSAVYNYSSRIMPQLQPGLAVSGGAQPSTCTVCR